MGKTTEAIVTVLTAIVGVAIIATLVSRQANTSGVVSSAGSAFSSIVRAATSPVTGGSSPLSIGPSAP